MKRTISILICLLLLGSTIAFADEFYESSAYHQYSGGYITASEQHYTSYRVNAKITVGAGIKVKGNPTEVVSKLAQAYVASRHKAGPYDNHSHYQYNY